MKIAFYDTKPYDIEWFEPLAAQHGFEIKFFEYKLSADNAWLAKGYDAVCIFVSDDADKDTIDVLYEAGVRIIALRCAGYNNVDLEAAKDKIKVVRVPAYSPNAVAEYAAALLLAVNRKIPRAYNRTREGNFSISGLMGMDLFCKTVGVIGTGKIGRVFMDICHGFKMSVVAYDPFPAADSGIKYVPLQKLFEVSDIISLHCPLTKDTYHIINDYCINKMKKGVIIINTSRGALIDSAALIAGLKARKIGGAGLDVYEEEEDYFFVDFSNEIIADDDLSRLLSLSNVIISSHQAFFTREAMHGIASTTIGNLLAFEKGETLENEVTI